MKGICKFLFFLFILSFPFHLFGHVLNGKEISQLSGSEVIWAYLRLGFLHILPGGADHVLFILGLFFLSPKLKSLIWQATAFTVAHTVTLGIAMLGVFKPPASIIEPIIALSIAFVAIENIIVSEFKPFRLAVVFLFGLIHGFGFAGALREIGMPENSFYTALFTFNAGVELGQIIIIVAAYCLIGKWFSQKTWYRIRIVIPASVVIAMIAIYWTIIRLMD